MHLSTGNLAQPSLSQVMQRELPRKQLPLFHLSELEKNSSLWFESSAGHPACCRAAHFSGLVCESL